MKYLAIYLERNVSTSFPRIVRYLPIKNEKRVTNRGRYGEGGATSEGRGSPFKNCCVLSLSAFALTDLKRFLKLLLWLTEAAWGLLPKFLDSIGILSSVGVDAPEVLLLLFSCGIRVLVVDVESTLADEVVPILQGRRRNRAVNPVDPFDGGENATLVVDVGVVDGDVVTVPLDSEKYEGLSVNMRTQGHRISFANRWETPRVLSWLVAWFSLSSRSFPFLVILNYANALATTQRWKEDLKLVASRAS